MNGSDVSNEPNTFVCKCQAVHKQLTQQHSVTSSVSPLWEPKRSLHHTSKMVIGRSEHCVIAYPHSNNASDSGTNRLYRRHTRFGIQTFRQNGCSFSGFLPLYEQLAIRAHHVVRQHHSAGSDKLYQVPEVRAWIVSHAQNKAGRAHGSRSHFSAGPWQIAGEHVQRQGWGRTERSRVRRRRRRWRKRRGQLQGDEQREERVKDDEYKENKEAGKKYEKKKRQPLWVSMQQQI